MVEWLNNIVYKAAGETKRYIANAGEEPLYFLTEEKGTVQSGIVVKAGQGCNKCFHGNGFKSLIELSKGETCLLPEKNQAITIATKNCEILCHGYAIPDYRGIIVSGERKELAKRGEVWIGESGHKYFSRPTISEKKQENLY